jgi:hypothetical protein
VCRSILVALDDAEKVGTKLLEESIEIETTRDALRRIGEVRDFVKNQFPGILGLSLVVVSSLEDGNLVLREAVEIAEVALKADWRWCFSGCLPVQKSNAPQSKTQKPPLTQPQEPQGIQEEVQPLPPKPLLSSPSSKPEHVQDESLSSSSNTYPLDPT